MKRLDSTEYSIESGIQESPVMMDVAWDRFVLVRSEDSHFLGNPARPHQTHLSSQRPMTPTANMCIAGKARAFIMPASNLFQRIRMVAF